jgi:hypothetical protein
MDKVGFTVYMTYNNNNFTDKTYAYIPQHQLIQKQGDDHYEEQQHKCYFQVGTGTKHWLFFHRHLPSHTLNNTTHS